MICLSLHTYSILLLYFCAIVLFFFIYYSSPLSALIHFIKCIKPNSLVTAFARSQNETYFFSAILYHTTFKLHSDITYIYSITHLRENVNRFLKIHNKKSTLKRMDFCVKYTLPTNLFNRLIVCIIIN